MGKTKAQKQRSIVKNLRTRTTRNTLWMQERDRRGITFLLKNLGRTEIEKRRAVVRERVRKSKAAAKERIGQAKKID